MTRFIAGALWLVLPSVAWAQCEGDWNNERLDAEIATMGEQLAAVDLEGTQRTVKGIVSGIPCLEERLDPDVLGRYARARALLSFLDQDEESAANWMLLATHVSPEGEVPGGLPEGHPFFAVLEDLEVPSVGQVEGGFVTPERGAVFIDGTFTPSPEAVETIPHVVQIFDRAAYPVETFWQDGAAFREGFVDPALGPTPVPTWYDPVKDKVRASSGPAKIKPEREPIDIPWVPILTTLGLSLTSVGSYAAAAGAQASLGTAASPDELTRSRSTANSLLLVSGLSMAGAVGVGAGTVMLHANGASVRLRF